MKRTLFYLLALNLSLATSAMAGPDFDTVGGSDMKRDDPKIVEALREPLALGRIAEAFNEALHTEEVARDLDSAAAKYAVIVKKFRARNDDWGAGAASLALFRLAEIRRKQARELEGPEQKARQMEARKLYEEVVAEFADWEPMASLARQQLGLDPSDFLPLVTEVEEKRLLTERVKRSLWKVRTRICDDKFVLVTFKVEPNEESTFEGIPEASEFQTLHYRPDDPLTGFISNTRVEGEVVRKGKILGNPMRETLVTRLTGFGHSFDVPTGLRQNGAYLMVPSDWIGKRESSYDAKVFWTFEDDMGKDRKVLTVVFTLETIPEAKARELAESRSIGLLNMADQPWSLTLPPAPAELGKNHGGK